MEKIRMTFDQYDHIIEVCEKIQQNYKDADVYSSKLNFTQMHSYPTVDVLRKHHVSANVEKCLKMLIFYTEVYQCDEPAFIEARQYMRQLIYDNLELVDADDE